MCRINHVYRIRTVPSASSQSSVRIIIIDDDDDIATVIADRADRAGPNTGTCLPSGFCEVYSWGPIEPSHGAPAILTQVQNMTLFIRATAFFPKYDKIINNIGNALQPGRNLFTVSDIVKASGYSFNQVAQNVRARLCSYAAPIVRGTDDDERSLLCVIGHHHCVYGRVELRL